MIFPWSPPEIVHYPDIIIRGRQANFADAQRVSMVRGAQFSEGDMAPKMAPFKKKCTEVGQVGLFLQFGVASCWPFLNLLGWMMVTIKSGSYSGWGSDGMGISRNTADFSALLVTAVSKVLTAQTLPLRKTSSWFFEDFQVFSRIMILWFWGFSGIFTWWNLRMTWTLSELHVVSHMAVYVLLLARVIWGNASVGACRVAAWAAEGGLEPVGRGPGMARTCGIFHKL